MLKTVALSSTSSKYLLSIISYFRVRSRETESNLWQQTSNQKGRNCRQEIKELPITLFHSRHQETYGSLYQPLPIHL